MRGTHQNRELGVKREVLNVDVLNPVSVEYATCTGDTRRDALTLVKRTRDTTPPRRCTSDATEV